MMISIIIIIIIITMHAIIAIRITTTLIVLLKSLVMITLVVSSLLVLSSVAATPHIITSIPSNTSILILSLPFFVMPFLYGDNLYYYVIQPRRFFWSHASNKTTYHHHVCTRGKLRGSFCLQSGGAAPPPTPPGFLNAMDACKRKQESASAPSMLAPKKQASGRIIHVCTWGKLRGTFCLQLGGCAPPTPRFLKATDACKKNTRVRSSPASMFAKNKHQVVAVRIIHVLH